MPKIIDNLHSKILKTVEIILKDEGYDKLTMRKVADRCGIAVGTLYNYYSEKSEMIRELMLEDWKETHSEMAKRSEKAEDLETGIRVIYESIGGFISRHRETWGLMENSMKGRDSSSIRYRPDRFFRDVDKILLTLMESVATGGNALARELLINNIIFLAMKPELDFDSVKKYLVNILN